MRGSSVRAVLASAAFSFAAAALASSVYITPKTLREAPSLDDAEKAALVDLDSPHMNAQVFAAMAMPYKYGVTQMPCKAKEWQPARGWKAAREPAGRIQWVIGPATKVFWSGIYGTCLIQSPNPRDAMSVVDRTALECECNGWMPTE